MKLDLLQILSFSIYFLRLENHSTTPPIELEHSSSNLPMPTATEADGYEAKRPTIEFGPVRAEDETVEQSDELYGRTTRRPPTIGQIGDEEWKGNGRRVEEELNEIIASVEREPRPTTIMLHHGHHPLLYGPPSSSSMEEDIIHPGKRHFKVLIQFISPFWKVKSTPLWVNRIRVRIKVIQGKVTDMMEMDTNIP